ncbi:hypothetical protein K502DRAFT_353604 [Neoconidiobolus thromboides FSU 785]|nr:hypothetical protein K502DRAFT_353604 [Neoconidiobolus thromboides FSU 785]
MNELERSQLAQIWIEDKNLDINTLLRWFNPITKELVTIEQCNEFLAWLFYDNYIQNLSDKENQYIKQLTDKIQLLSNIKLSNEQNKQNEQKESRKVMRLTLDKLNVLLKPLIIYIIICLIQTISSIYLLINGFQHNHDSETQYSYYIYEPNNLDNTKDTLFFIHGIGIGLTTYLKKISELKQCYPNRKIILLQLNYITMTPTIHINTIEDTLKFLDNICELHNIQKISLIGHSYGTFICSWLVKYRKQKIQQLTLIDPVCFNTWDSNLTRNFIYNQQFTLISICCDLIISKDLFIANTIARHFLWLPNLLLLQDIKGLKVNVFLAKEDFIINSNNVLTYLKKSPEFDNKLKVMMLDGNHGAYLLSQTFSDIVLKGV